MPTLNWIGKEAVVKHHKEVPFRLLEPVAALSCSTRPRAGEVLGERVMATENHIVQGDKLHTPQGLVWKPNEELVA
jgi:adenine-specific DNA-methyltransferase